MAVTPLSTGLAVVVLEAARKVAEGATYVEEDSLGHTGHRDALATAAGVLAYGGLSLGYVAAIQTDLEAFVDALDARYNLGVHGGPPPSSGTLSGFVNDVVANGGNYGAIETIERWHGRGPTHYAGIAGRGFGRCAMLLGTDATYVAALTAAVGLLDARYASGTTTTPVGTALDKMKTALTLVARQAAESVATAVERAMGHVGHLAARRSESGDAAVSKAITSFEPNASAFMAFLDGRYHVKTA